MKAVTCRATIIQSSQGAPTHDDADETTAGTARVAPVRGAVLAPATPLAARGDGTPPPPACHCRGGRASCGGVWHRAGAPCTGGAIRSADAGEFPTRAALF